jgi:cellulose biosynthesis protein BcsQ
MLKVLFYSYKGGAGRTTASANVAAALAKRGQRVLCLDLDLEGPGLHILAQCPDGNQFYIQQYLREPTLEDDTPELGPEDVQSKVIDVLPLLRGGAARVAANLAVLEATDRLGVLHLIPATQEITPIPARGTYLEMKLKRLCAHVDGHYDYLIIDSASGIRNLSALALTVSDLVLLFFQWSKQSFAGTLQMCRFLNRLKDTRQARPYWLVASAVPRWPDDPQQAGSYKSRIKELSKVLQSQMPDAPLTIQERLDLRWEERVVVFDDLNGETDYDVIASKLIRYNTGPAIQETRHA